MGGKSIKVNFIMNIILTMSSFLFPLITFPYVCRILLPVGTGKVSFATSLVSYFSMFSQLGIPTYGIRACAKVRDNKEELTRTTHELLFINLIMSIVSYIILFFSIHYIPKLREEKLLYIVISLTIILSSIGMEWLYKALEQYMYIAIRSIIFKFIALIATFLLIHSKDDYVLYGGITIFAASASNIMNFINIKKYIDIKLVGKYNIKRHFKPIFVFFAMACATTIYTNLDNVMLGFLKNDIEVGIYNAAVKIKYILTSIVTSLGTVLLPRTSYYVQNNMFDEFERITKKALSFIFLIAIPLIVYFMFFSKESILFLSGKDYEGAILPMLIIMPTVLLIGISNLLGIQILVPLGKEKIVLKAEICGAFLDVVINALLIPKLGSIGAAIGTLVAECIVTFLCIWTLKEKIVKSLIEIRYIHIFIACICGIVCCFWLKLLDLSNIITLIVSSVIFASVFGVVMILFKDSIVLEVINFVKKKVKIFIFRG